MGKYQIRIIETLEKIVTVDAKNENEALFMADNNYRKADDDYILSGENLTDVKFEIER